MSAYQVVADDEIVGFGYLAEFAVSHVEHFGDDAVIDAFGFADISKVEERDERFGVALLDADVSVAEDDDVVEALGVDVDAASFSRRRRDQTLPCDVKPTLTHRPMLWADVGEE